MSKRARAGTRSPKVLVVDDHEISLGSTVAALRETAGSVKQARTLNEAMALALDWLPDAICTDLDLDGDSGLELIRALREQWPADLPQPDIVAISGDPRPVARALAALGVQHTLTKPVEPGDLRSALYPANHVAAGLPTVGAIEELFERELQRRLPQLDRSIGMRDLQDAARVLHQLVASSAICGHRTLERRLRELHAACRCEAPAADLAAAYFNMLRAVADYRMAENELKQ